MGNNSSSSSRKDRPKDDGGQDDAHAGGAVKDGRRHIHPEESNLLRASTEQIFPFRFVFKY
eukprot:scaffold161980_cov40-Prasinocladus_malaysianus.AAC.3